MNYQNKEDFLYRLSIFNLNTKIVNEENAKNAGYELELNMFAAMTEEEFES